MVWFCLRSGWKLMILFKWVCILSCLPPWRIWKIRLPKSRFVMLLSLTLKLSGGNIIFRLCALDPKAQSDARHVGKVAVQFPTRPAKRRLRTNLLEKWMSFRLPYKKGLPFILEMNHPKKEPSIFRGHEMCELFFDFYAFFPGKLELVYFCKNLFSNLSKILPRYTERNIPPGLKSLSADEGNLVFQSILRFLRECQEDTPPSLTVYLWKVPLRHQNGEKKKSSKHQWQ